MTEAGATQAAVARAAGYESQGAIGNALARGSLPKNLRAIAEFLGVRLEWLETGALPKKVADKAHAVSPDSVTSPLQRDPELVDWGDLGMRELPRAFAVDAPDDAMAPIIRRGMKCEFETDIEPGQDDIVLLHDGAGSWYIRHYVPGPRKRWEATAEKERVLTMDSERDELTVIAVLTHVQRRRPTV